jgi:hypothetical protein
MMEVTLTVLGITIRSEKLTHKEDIFFFFFSFYLPETPLGARYISTAQPCGRKELCVQGDLQHGVSALQLC